MGCEMEIDQSEDTDIVLSSMWPEDMNEAGRQFNVERPGADQDMLEEVVINKEPNIVDFKRLMELTNYSDKGNWQLANLVKNWEYKQANAVRLLREELDNLSKQQQEVELKKLEILEEHRFERDGFGGDKRPISILDENLTYLYQHSPQRKNDIIFRDERVELDAEYDSIIYWKQRAMSLEKLLEASVRREQVLLEKLQESIENLERQSSPVAELSQVLARADNFLHFVLQNAPVVIGHQDKELRYRFIFNHFPSLREEDIIGKTDVEIFSGDGVKESQDFKREVLERGLPAKREITFETDLFGSKTFLIYVEPVFSKAGDTIGVNYMGMEVTDQVRKREKIGKLREEMAVQKAKETELNKTIHITEESMRAKQMLATMSHEIRSPLSGVVSMAEILSSTKLEKEQRQMVKVMLSSGDLVLQLINDILDLSKVESGVMKLEATKFRPREVVKHVLQTAAASIQKLLTLEGNVADDVPVEVMDPLLLKLVENGQAYLVVGSNERTLEIQVIGDVLRIRQILTNLVSNAIKFTHEGKVGINLCVVTEPQNVIKQDSQKISSNQMTVTERTRNDSSTSWGKGDQNDNKCGRVNSEDMHRDSKLSGNPGGPVKLSVSMEEDEEIHPNTEEKVVWIRCDVYDTGIGIPENAIPTLFKKYMQVGSDTARKYGGTGLGLAICKQLVELMGGYLTVSSVEQFGSTFTFIIPYKVSSTCDGSDDPDELSDLDDQDVAEDDDSGSGVFVFQPRNLGSLFSSQSSGRIQKLTTNGFGLNASSKCNGLFEDSLSPSSNITYKETSSEEDTSSAQNISELDVSLCQNLGLGNANSVAAYEEGSSEMNGRIQKHTGEVLETSVHSETNQAPAREILKSEVKPKILLVEDNKINVMVTKSMMKQLGHGIDVVNNGAEAVRAVQQQDFDLILMDVCMPVMDGLQATRLIRSFEETGSWEDAVKAGIDLQSPPPHSSPNSRLEKSRKRIPIIAMTANALSESGNECFANGMDSFVSKPVTFQNLKQCLSQYLP